MWAMRRRWIGAGIVGAVLAGGTVAAVHLAQPDPALRTLSVGSFPYAVAMSADCISERGRGVRKISAVEVVVRRP